MAANLIACASNRCFAACSCTSCALQYGHQSAERKNSTTVPFGLFRLSLDISRPNWSRAVKGGIFRSTFEPVRGETKSREEDLFEPQPRPKKQRETISVPNVLVFNAWFLRPSDWRSTGWFSHNAPDSKCARRIPLFRKRASHSTGFRSSQSKIAPGPSISVHRKKRHPPLAGISTSLRRCPGYN